MSITQEQLENIIKNLSKLPSSNPKILEDVQNIIEYMQLLNEIDTTGVIPTVSVSNFNGKLREDTEHYCVTPKELLNCSKQQVIAGQIALPNIMA